MILYEFPTVLDAPDTEPCLIVMSEIAAVQYAGEDYCVIHLKSGHEIQVAVAVSVVKRLLETTYPSSRPAASSQ